MVGRIAARAIPQAGWCRVFLALVALPALLALSGSACRRGDQPLGPLESYLLLTPSGIAGPASAEGAPLVRALPIGEEPALTLGRLLDDGFTSEMVRTVHLAKQLVRAGGADHGGYPDEVRAAAAEPLCLVVGVEAPAPSALGLTFPGWFGRADRRPEIRWIGLSGHVEGDKALAQTLTGRLAAHAADWVAGGARPGPTPLLVEAYRMAMEVIAREWRSGAGGGAGAVLHSTSGTFVQRQLFATIRENRAVLLDDGSALRPAPALLADARVAATIIHRLAQTRSLARSAGPAAVYTPFVSTALPAGVSPAAVLGPVRNFQAKLFSAWARAVGHGHPPHDIVDLLQAYGDLFPDERAELTRVFLVTTFGATVVPGGLSQNPADATATITRIATLTEDVVAGRRGLRDAIVERK